MNRRAFVKSGLLFVPTLLLPRRSLAQEALVNAVVSQQHVAPAGGGSFTDPSSYGPVAWYHNTAVNDSVYKAGPALAGNGENIVAWNDVSGNANHLATSGNTFLYRTAIQNSLPVIETASGGSLYRSTLVQEALSQPLTMYGVCHFTANQTVKVLIVDGAASAGATRCVIYADGTDHFVYYAGTSSIANSSASSTGWFVVAVVFNGSSSLMRLNGTQVATGDPGSNGYDGCKIGAQNSTDDFGWGDDVAEVIVYGEGHDATKLANVEGWLKSKWGTP